jgi:ferredoxin
MKRPGRLSVAARSYDKAMKVHVSRDCGAHGQCHWINPSLFPLDDDGYSAVVELPVPGGAEADARAAAAACPAAAISVEEG